MATKILNVLPQLFHIRNDTPFVPYRPFQELFVDYHKNPFVIIKSGRQVSKTTSAIIHTLCHALRYPHFYTLIITPLEIQARRLTTDFLLPIIKASPIFKVCRYTNSAFKVRLYNGSTIEASYSSTSKEAEDTKRIRGISADKLHLDEVQDIPYNAIPAIRECLSASKYQYLLFTGTPRTLNNTLQYLWERSTANEWCIPCRHCGHNNICCVEEDLLRIIGPYRDDICEERPATCCSRCGGIIYPQEGFWLPKHPTNSWVGYHIPQVIIPTHYANPKNWKVLLDKQNLQGYTLADFYREVLGEAYDVATRLVSVTTLRKAATLGPRDKDFKELLHKWIPRYRMTALGIDWGGGGEEGNYTTIALCGITYDGIIEVPWAYESPTPHDHIGEARLILHLLTELKPNLIAHDYSGAGALRETILIQSGVPIDCICPVRYVGNQGVALRIVPATPDHPRTLIQVDKNKCLLYVIGALAQQKLYLFDDFDAPKSLIKQFLSLIDEKHSYPEKYRIIPEPGARDEFPQAVLLGSVVLWHIVGFPTFLP